MNDKRILFKQFVDACNKNDFIIGQGNPISNILFIGCEPSGKPELKETNKMHTYECLSELSGKSFDKLWVTHPNKKEGCTWKKYQKIINTIYPDREHAQGNEIDFEEMAFCTELNNVCARHSKDADKSTIAQKIDLIKESSFIQSFPVVILACGGYIVNQADNRQIDDTFGVTFSNLGLPEDSTQNYWIHYNIDPDKPRLVIHTRQLSGGIKNELVFSIGNTIKQFLISNNL